LRAALFVADVGERGDQGVNVMLIDATSFDCQTCGACCATDASWPRFSVESDAELDRIPAALVDDSLGRMRCVGDRCAALSGEIGKKTGCTIYAIRPIVCRDCQPGDPECLIARAKHGIGPTP
jgi:Fe-S-cluster containining protein